MAEQKVTITDSKKLNYYYEEAMKTLRTNIQLAGRKIKSILFTSTCPHEGKSELSFQLAKEFAKLGKSVVLVDADIRKPPYVGKQKIKQDILGLSHYLCGQVPMERICYHTNFENMDIIFSGTVSPNPSELLEDSLFTELLEALKQRYDYVLVDSPPIGSVIDAAIIAKQCDGAVFVVESETTSHKFAKRALTQLEKTGCRILGAVLNKVDYKKEKYYGKYDDYYYGESSRAGGKA